MFCDYSLLSSPLFLVAALVLYYLRINSVLVILLICVGLLSCVHHTRNFNASYNDALRYVDILFAISLGIVILYVFGWPALIYLIPAVLIFIFGSCSKLDPCLKSFLHMLLHIIIVVGLIVQAIIVSKCTKNSIH